jgi:curved DNA-binding protein CbpA
MAALDHYEVLGVSPNASPAEIKAAFRKLAKQLHPDKRSGPDAAELFQQLTKSYEVLSDPERRKHFDWLRDQRKRQAESTRPPPISPSPPPKANEGERAKGGDRVSTPHAGGARRAEGARRRKYRHEVARNVRAHGKENVKEHAVWLDELESEELSLSERARKSHATFWLATVLLLLVAALLVFGR